MVLNVDKHDLACMVKGSTPNYISMNRAIIKRAGQYIGGHVDEWRWFPDLDKLFSEEELYTIYLICKNSK